MVCLQCFRAFEDVQIFWRATFNKAALTLVNNGVNLTRQLVATSGVVLCKKREIMCALTLEALDDEVRGWQEHLKNDKHKKCSQSYSKGWNC